MLFGIIPFSWLVILGLSDTKNVSSDSVFYIFKGSSIKPNFVSFHWETKTSPHLRGISQKK